MAEPPLSPAVRPLPSPSLPAAQKGTAPAPAASSVASATAPTAAIRRKCVLWTHEERTLNEDIVVSPEVFPHIKVGDFVEITQAISTGDAAASDRDVRRIVLQVASLKSNKANQQTVTMAKHIADLFQFQMRKDCFVDVIEPDSVRLDFVQLTIKDQYVSRNDMWRVKNNLVGTAVYVGKKVSFAGIRAQVKQVFINGATVPYGIVCASTKSVFRSESAKVMIFIQMSREMWSFDEDGDLYFEKAVQGFLPELFDRWSAAGSTHVVTIVLFSRFFYESPPSSHPDRGYAPPNRDADGRYYEDFYKVVVDWELRTDWAPVLLQLKREFLTYNEDVARAFPDTLTSPTNSMAMEGNFLEAVNLALNIFDKAHINRDLIRTGLSVLMVTPGAGIFHVDASLVGLTKQRTVDNGIGCDVVCLRRPPLHTVPLFVMRRADSPDGIGYALPHWIDISFYNKAPVDRARPFRVAKFTPRCDMHELQSGRFEMDAASSAHALTLLTNVLSPPATGEAASAGYDRAFFTASGRPPISSSQKQKSRHRSQQDDDARLSSSLRRGASSTALSALHSPSNKAAALASSSSAILAGRPPATPVTHSRAGSDDHDLVAEEALSWGQRTATRAIPAGSGGHRRVGSNTGSPRSVDPDDYDAAHSGSALGVGGGLMPPPAAGANAWTASVATAAPGVNYGGPLVGTPQPITAWSLHLMQRKAPSGGKVGGDAHRANRIINPSNPARNQHRVSAYRRRWYHAFPMSSAKEGAMVELPSVQWHSLCTPAILPLTTDYFPPTDELKRNYTENSYTLELADEVHYYKDLESLFKELIGQRLAQGFQIVVNASTYVGTVDPSRSPQQEATCALSIGNHFQQIRMVRSEQNLELTRIIRKNHKTSAAHVYPFSVWPRLQDGYMPRRTAFEHAGAAALNWSPIDFLIAGHFAEREMSDRAKCWRVRFAVVPMSSVPQNAKLFNIPQGDRLSDEELRIAAFVKFLESFDKAKRYPKEQVTVWLEHTTQQGSGELLRVGAQMRAEKTQRARLKRDPLLGILAAMVDPEHGVPIKDRKWHRRVYPKCAVGHEITDWLFANVEDADSREEAIKLGEELLSAGMLLHVNNTHRFLDGYYFYQLREDMLAKPKDAQKEDVPPSSRRWFRLGKQEKPASAMSSQTSLLSPSVSHQYPNGDSVKCLVIDTDPNKKSDRPEWALLHYDTSFHPQHAYHFQLHWLVCTGRLLDELLQTWSRRANQLGLSLIEVPITPGYLQSDDTLLSSVTVPLAVPPHTLASLNLDDTFSDLPPTYFEDALLRQFNFVFSVGPTDAAAAARPGSNVLAHKYPQYIHRTGFAIVYILDGGRGFIWENNRLLCSRVPNYNYHGMLGEFTEFCANGEELRRFWNDERSRLLAQVGHDSDDEKDDDVADDAAIEGTSMSSESSLRRAAAALSSGWKGEAPPPMRAPASFSDGQVTPDRRGALTQRKSQDTSQSSLAGTPQGSLPGTPTGPSRLSSSEAQLQPQVPPISVQRLMHAGGPTSPPPASSKTALNSTAPPSPVLSRPPAGRLPAAAAAAAAQNVVSSMSADAIIPSAAPPVAQPTTTNAQRWFFRPMSGGHGGMRGTVAHYMALRETNANRPGYK